MMPSRNLLAAVGLSIGHSASPASWSQQPPTTEALRAAEMMLTAQQRVGASATLAAMANAAVEGLPEAKSLQPEIKSEIAKIAASAAQARMPAVSSDLASLFASAMSVDEMRSVTMFFEGPVIQALQDAQ